MSEGSGQAGGAVATAAAHPGPTSGTTVDPDPEVVVEEEATLAASRARGFLSCARCGQHLEYSGLAPRLLPACLHTVCQLCAGGEVQCALCQTTSPSVADHPLLEELLRDTHARQQAAGCGQCSERGVSASVVAGSCLDCQTDLCQNCIDAHKITKATWDHKVKLLPDAKQEDRCPEHDKAFDYYCDGCEVLACGECILSAHRSHASSTLADKAAQVRAALRSCLDGMSGVKMNVSVEIAKLKSRMLECADEKQKSTASVSCGV
ncbi:transcription intermediary factor 1-beta-like [Pollicipes pollicipes]|uniref:transcription intermediary factor 1-beta-like n=1 Tax=Pollicipes pollicipes TaxID=41117 RepID=UPI00188553CF|nr:transcription intermediary factor 1-beta-like [Pollicipes pollicipes]